MMDSQDYAAVKHSEGDFSTTLGFTRERVVNVLSCSTLPARECPGMKSSSSRCLFTEAVPFPS
jgi:hypothetical protein